MALHERRPDEALERTDRVLATMARLVETLIVRAGALLDLGYPELALAYIETALDLDPTHGDGAVERCRALLDLGDLEGAVADLRELAESYPDDPEVIYLLAMAEDLGGGFKRADRLYDRASRLDPTRFNVPVRVDTSALVAEARSVLLGLPADVRSKLDSVDVQVLPVPDPTLLDGEQGPLPPTLLGLFHGTDLEQRAQNVDGAMPARILLFQRNLERIALGPEDLREQVRITVLHEVGHYLGFDEADMTRLGLE